MNFQLNLSHRLDFVLCFDELWKINEIEMKSCFMLCYSYQRMIELILRSVLEYYQPEVLVPTNTELSTVRLITYLASFTQFQSFLSTLTEDEINALKNVDYYSKLNLLDFESNSCEAFKTNVKTVDNIIEKVIAKINSDIENGIREIPKETQNKNIFLNE
jgi:hypothetical protein